ncbi:MAG: TRZ/ATZ family protein [Ruminococcaceae bacterium]|nr:TRZ/ATZ family protein [Oscillospiraceae bacterium]
MSTTQPFYVHTDSVRKDIQNLHAGDAVMLSGTIYTARDAAHKKLCAMIADQQPLPIELQDAVIYYAGPTPTKDNGQIGSIGPTTSSRMDAFAPTLLANGLALMIGKGTRNEAVCNAIINNKAAYFCAAGGLGALISKSILNCKEIAFPELGCESIKKLTVENMPLIAAILPNGENIFNRQDT